MIVAARGGTQARTRLSLPEIPSGCQITRVGGAKGWGAKRIARELGLARNTVRRYLRGGPAAEVQERPNARRLDGVTRAEALSLFEGAADYNAVVVADILAQRGVEASLRTVQRVVSERRRKHLAADLATVRFETAPGRQMQIDFGERKVWIAGEQVTVHFLVAVLSYSRRLFVKAFLHERRASGSTASPRPSGTSEGFRPRSWGTTRGASSSGATAPPGR